MKSGKKAFTLVELLIVITILAILATIAFLSFRDYMKDARDGNRLATMREIETGLGVFSIKSSTYPMPDNSAVLRLSGSVISNQGYFGTQATQMIQMSKVPLDPLDKERYFYAVGEGGRGYKLLGYTEANVALVPQAYAGDYSDRLAVVRGQGPGMILDENNQVVLQDTDFFLSGASKKYTAFVEGTTSVSGSGIELGGGLQMLALKGGIFAPPSSCPSGFIPVPGNPEFMQPGFCVAKYEMALERDLVGTGELNYIDPSNNWNTWKGTTNSQSGSLTTWLDGPIVSAPGKYPIARITQTQAIAACQSIGGHLITNNEWMTIARNIEANPVNWSSGQVGSGYISNGVSSGAILGCGGANTKAIYPDLPLLRATKTGPGGNASCDERRQLKLNNGEIIRDLAGNVREHVNGRNTINGENFATMPGNVCGGDNWYSFTNATTDTIAQCNFTNGYSYANIGPKTPNLNASNGIGRIYSYSTGGTNRVFLRGGTAHHDDAYTGVFTMKLHWSSSDQYVSVGFRCAF